MLPLNGLAKHKHGSKRKSLGWQEEI